MAPPTALRIVFGTNVVLSALVFPTGRLAPIRGLWRSAQAIPLVSRATTEELLRALAYPKFKLDSAEREELLGDFLPFAEAVTIPTLPPRTPDCRDQADVPFLQLALSGRADALVSGDADLLALADRFPIPILRPDVWLAAIHVG